MIWKPFSLTTGRMSWSTMPKDPEFTHSTTVKPMCLNNRLKMLFLSRQWLHKFLNYGISCPKSNTFLNQLINNIPIYHPNITSCNIPVHHISKQTSSTHLQITHTDAISIIPHHRDICASPTFLRYWMPPLRRSATLRWWAPQVAAERQWEVCYWLRHDKIHPDSGWTQNLNVSLVRLSISRRCRTIWARKDAMRARSCLHGELDRDCLRIRLSQPNAASSPSFYQSRTERWTTNLTKTWNRSPKARLQCDNLHIYYLTTSILQS